MWKKIDSSEKLFHHPAIAPSQSASLDTAFLL